MTGNPFPVFVLASLTNKQEKVVSAWSYLEKPMGVAVNSKNEVEVALFGGSIIRFDTEGRRKTLLNNLSMG